MLQLPIGQLCKLFPAVVLVALADNNNNINNNNDDNFAASVDSQLPSSACGLCDRETVVYFVVVVLSHVKFESVQRRANPHRRPSS